MGYLPTTIVDSQEMQQWSLRQRQQSQTVGFVPTMGALHEGHLSLVELAKQQAEKVVVSIFVNPTQFGENEDFSKYPRTLKEDLAKLADHQVDCVFTPTAATIYPEGFQTYLTNTEMANRLEGASRPGHFDGVLTVVMKLFQLVQPHCAIFGKKDYQQLAIIRKMVTDYLLPLAIVPAETSRESDGLARSSRNRYFDDQHRSIAPLISAGLQEAAQLFSRGERQTAKLRETVLAKISSHPAFAVEYVEICRRDSLEPCGEQITEAAVILVAARLAGVRLIDNWELD